MTTNSKSTFCTLDGSPNALAVNKDATLVVVAGRNVFKVYSIEDDKFDEKYNLRVGKNVNLNFSCGDVVWNPVEDNILATAATNGAVVTWNLSKTGRSKQDLVYTDHRRTVNKVCFHNTEPHLLLSGSQDGTMKCFDLRKKEATSTFYSLSESVRDVQFCPHHYFQFAAVQENGNVQLWDLRRPDRYERQFTAHNGPVFSCDWHPEEKRWLATAGRDRTIKVWDVALKPYLEHCIQTIASVAHVKWRPSRKHHITSSSLVVDFSINVWDVNRPYIPFAAFTDHKDVTTGFAWRSDPQVLVSTSKDCKLYQLYMNNAERPADHANPVALNISNYGEISYAASNHILGDNGLAVKTGAYAASTRIPGFLRKTPNQSEQFRSASSSFLIFTDIEKQLSMKWFVESARRYKLSGLTLSELCEHNACVAMDLQRPQVAQTWRILKLLHTSNFSLENDFLPHSSNTEIIKDEKALDGSHEGNQRSSRHSSGNTNFPARSHTTTKAAMRHVSGGTGAPCNEHAPGDTSGQTEDDSEGTDDEHDKTLTSIAVGMGNANGDFFFGDGNIDQLMGYSFPQIMSFENNQDWKLPNEAFQPRQPIRDSSPPPEISNDLSSHQSLDEEENEQNNVTVSDEDHSWLLTTFTNNFIPWSHTTLIVDMLHFYAEQGDVQMSVSVLLVLGDKLKHIIPESIQEQWFNSYIDILSRFQLWNVVTVVIQLNSVPSISCLNQQSTTVQTQCGLCQKQLNRIGWFCDNCRVPPALCNLCHQTVRGLFVWCQGCGHGGHPQHIEEWLKSHVWCPAGCGHICEYT